MKRGHRIALMVAIMIVGCVLIFVGIFVSIDALPRNRYSWASDVIPLVSTAFLLVLSAVSYWFLFGRQKFLRKREFKARQAEAAQLFYAGGGVPEPLFMHVTAIYTKEGLKEAHLFVAMPKSKHRLGRFATPVINIVLVVLDLLFLHIWVLAVVSGVLFGLWLLMLYAAGSSVRKQIDPGQNDFYFYQTHMRIFFQSVNRRGEDVVLYNQIEKLYETDTAFYFQSKPNGTYYLPKNPMPAEAQEALRGHLLQCVPGEYQRVA